MSLTLPPLPHALDALEPHISRRTLAAHHRRLRITATSNAQTPLVSNAIPLLNQHRRIDYIATFLAHLVNWDFANRQLAMAEQRVTLARDPKAARAIAE